MSKNKIDLDKYRSIGNLSSGYKNKTRIRRHRDDQGKYDGGFHRDHFDGRVDATIAAKPVKVKSQTQGGQE